MRSRIRSILSLGEVRRASIRAELKRPRPPSFVSQANSSRWAAENVKTPRSTGSGRGFPLSSVLGSSTWAGVGGAMRALPPGLRGPREMPPLWQLSATTVKTIPFRAASRYRRASSLLRMSGVPRQESAGTMVWSMPRSLNLFRMREP